MATIEVLTVSPAASAPDQLVGAHLDLPQQGQQSSTYLLQVVGWVLSRESRAVSLEVTYRGAQLQAVPVSEPRPDVARAYPDMQEARACGFRAVVSVLGLSPRFDLELVAVLSDGRRVSIGSLEASHEPIRSGFEPRLRPIVVSSLPRAGTTRLMQMLGAHPQIVVFRRYPYEHNVARYWMHLLRTFLEPANITRPVEDISELMWDPSYNPFYEEPIVEHAVLGEWLGRTQVERLAAFCQESIENWYLEVASAQGQDRPAYFAEKHVWPGQIPVLMAELYPDLKELTLVRDFRDMVCSILAFDEARNYAGFRRPDGKTDAEYVRENLAPAVAEFRDNWQSRRERSHLVRYEDLVLEPAATMTGVLEHLGLEASPAALDQVLEQRSDGELREHRTSPDLESSIGRWQREHDEPFRALCNEVFGDALGAFGYRS